MANGALAAMLSEYIPKSFSIGFSLSFSIDTFAFLLLFTLDLWVAGVVVMVLVISCISFVLRLLPFGKLSKGLTLNVLYERKNRLGVFNLVRCGITDSILSNAFDPVRVDSAFGLMRFGWWSVTMVADLRRFLVGICSSAKIPYDTMRRGDGFRLKRFPL